MPNAASMDRMEGQRRRRDGGKDEGLAVKAHVVGYSGRPFQNISIIAYNPCAGKPLLGRPDNGSGANGSLFSLDRVATLWQL